MADDTRKSEDDDLLDYLAGRAAPETVVRIEAEARENPQLAAEIALMRGAKAAMADEGDNAPGAMGWARLERAMAAEDMAARPQRPVWQIAAASAVAAVAVWQLVAAPMLTPAPDGYVTATGQAGDGPAATIAFAPNATEADIRALLLDTGAEVTGGPSALGLWRLRFADEAARDAALARFADAPGIVESAQAD